MFWARPSDWGVRPEAADARGERSGRRGGPKKFVERAFVLSVDLPVDDRCVPLARCFLDLSGRPMSYRLFSWAKPGHRSRSPRDPGFMNPIESERGD